VSAIDDILKGLGGVAEKIKEAAAEAKGVDSETEDALNQAEGLGAKAAVEAFTALKSEVEELLTKLAAAVESVDEALETAQSVADST
jgi:phage shock protein A